MSFRILHYKTLDSTSDLAKTFAEKGAAANTVIVADYQEKGRGQFDRTWQSPRGKDLLFSIILRPNRVKANALPIITQIAAEVIRDVLRSEFGFKATIKKPNDVLVGGKKICGILTEGSTQGGWVGYVILGIGLNVNSTKKELLRTATSIKVLSGKMYDQKLILEKILSKWSEWHDKNQVSARN